MSISGEIDSETAIFQNRLWSTYGSTIFGIAANIYANKLSDHRKLLAEINRGPEKGKAERRRDAMAEFAVDSLVEAEIFVVAGQGYIEEVKENYELVTGNPPDLQS